MVLLLPVTIFFWACKKDPVGKTSGDIYIASPEKLLDMAGKDWEALKPSLDDKKGYWYTEFTQSQDRVIKAAISLPAVEETNHNIGYLITMNVDRITNKAIYPSIETDTLMKLSFTDAANLMLEYYNRSLVLCGDTTFTHGQYIETGGLDGSGLRKTTVADVVDKLTNGVEADQYTIIIWGHIKGFSAVMTKNERMGSYVFSFDSYDF